MAGLVPAIHDLRCFRQKEVVDDRHKAGHDGVGVGRPVRAIAHHAFVTPQNTGNGAFTTPLTSLRQAW